MTTPESARTHEDSRALEQRAREVIPGGARTYSNDYAGKTIEATRGALEVYKRGLDNGVETVLEGRPVRSVDCRRG